MSARNLRLLIPTALAGLVAMYAVIAYDGAETSYRLWYYVPAALAAGALAADRYLSRCSICRAGWILDVAISLLCLSRPIFGWPAASGHAVYFLYALLTATSGITRIYAVILGGVTLYAKIWLWNWDATLWPGLWIGAAGGLLYLALHRRKPL